MRSRAVRILELPLDFMDNELFAKPNADKVVLGPVPAKGRPWKRARLAQRPAALPGQFVRGAAVDAGAGSALFPQIQLSQVQSRRSSARGSIRYAPMSSVMDEIEQLTKTP